MTDDNSWMPPLPPHPDSVGGWDWTDAERRAVLAYGRQVAQMCAEICCDAACSGSGFNSDGECVGEAEIRKHFKLVA